MVGHLAGCPRCTAIYAEVVAGHLDASSGELGTSGDDWIRAGLEAGPRATTRFTAAPKQRPRRRRVLAMVVIAASLIAGSALVLRTRLFESARLSPERNPSDATNELRVGGNGQARTNPLEAALMLVGRMARADSYGGLLYSAQLLPEPGGTRGGVRFDDRHLDEIRRQAGLHADDPDIAFWLVCAMLSTGELRAADGYLTDANRRFPADPRFANLAAILAFKRDDLAGAERHLRGALGADRTGVVKLNLIHVLTGLGRHADAGQLTNELRREHADLAHAAGL